MNDRGQALVESLFLGIVIVSLITLALQYALKAQKHFVMDELLEETLICLVSENQNCEAHLRRSLIDQGYKSISIQTQRIRNKWALNLKAISFFDEKIERESELEYDLKVSL